MVAGLSAVAAVAAGAHPTGWAVADALLAGGLGAATALAAPLAGPRVVAVAGAVAVVCSGRSTPSALCAGAALGAVAALFATGQRSPGVLLLAGAALAQAALRFQWPAPTGGPSVAAALAVGPILVLGLARAPRPVRRAVGLATGAFVAGSIVFSALAGLAVLEARSAVERGITAARSGLTAAEGSDRETAANQFGAATDSFRSANRSIGAWWARPALAVPVVGRQALAVRTMAGSGVDLAAAGARAAREADPSSIHLTDGAVDLQALEAVRRPLEAAADSLRRADKAMTRARSPFLVGPVATRLDDLADKVHSASGSAETAVLALRTAPALLGADGPRRYFVAVQNPAESRASGGLIGNFGELVSQDGVVSLGRFGRVQELNEAGDALSKRITGPADYVRRYAPWHPSRYWQSITLSPDFPTVAQAIEQLYPQSGGQKLDGVISMDPAAFAALLRVVGPVPVEGHPDITADDAEKLLLHDQYVSFGQAGESDRVGFLDTVTQSVFGRLTGTSLPSPRIMADALAPAVAGRHIQLASIHPDEQRFFERIGAAGAVPAVQGDALGVVTQNFDGNKIDWFLHRSYTYDASFDPATGKVDATLTIRLQNDAPASGLPKSVIGYGGPIDPDYHRSVDGENFTMLAVYSPLELQTMVTDDGQDLQVSRQNELGRRVYWAYVSIPTMTTRTVTLKLSGRVARGDYRLDIAQQPMVHPDRATVSVDLAGGWEGRIRTSQPWSGTVTARLVVDRSRTVAVDVRRTASTLLARLRAGR
ncbi:MAG TPA: DUF4012 domain-containing protein [Acidimicrobiales bacterium]|nr:DUF4012 domain-containing protein [Acidimicrobiales bacterium]